MKPVCVLGLRLRGLSVGLDVERRESCIIAFWGELQDRGWCYFLT